MSRHLEAFSQPLGKPPKTEEAKTDDLLVTFPNNRRRSREMANAHTEVISLCVKHPGEQSREQRFMLAHCFFISSPWSPSLLAFRSVEGEHVAGKKKTPPTLQGCLGYREMRKGETSALCVCTNHLISSHQASTPQNSTPTCHWFVITPLWVNIGEGFLSNHGKSRAQLDEAPPLLYQMAP